jgi:hypothetical protein
MKYIKLFENFQSNFSVGYILDGGNKSYPCVLDSSMVEKIESMVDSDFTFIVKEELNAFPEALLIVYGDPDEYSSDGQSYMEGITNEFAQQIISIANSDIYTNDKFRPAETEGARVEKTEDEIAKDEKAFYIAGYDYGTEYEEMMFGDDEEGSAGYRVLCVIPNIKPNTVYESDSQEATGYWEPPYKAIPLDEYLGNY